MSGRNDFYSAQENTFKAQSTFTSFIGSPWHWQQDDVIPNYLWGAGTRLERLEEANEC